jgi:hypothetical protein
MLISSSSVLFKAKEDMHLYNLYKMSNYITNKLTLIIVL